MPMTWPRNFSLAVQPLRRHSLKLLTEVVRAWAELLRNDEAGKAHIQDTAARNGTTSPERVGEAQ